MKKLFLFVILILISGCKFNGWEQYYDLPATTTPPAATTPTAPSSGAPVLNNLVISSSDSSSITLQQSTFSAAGDPVPTVNAYIGINGVITASGSVVSGSIQGPIDVSLGAYQFTGLNSDTSYKIIVVAENYLGYSVMQIIQSTADVAPVLNNLVISSSNSSSITLQRPTFSTAGNPAPTVQAYIGVNGTISVTGSTVSNSAQGPIDVSSGGYQFTGLNLLTVYCIIVVAENTQGYSVKQIIQSTAGIAPVLNNLVVSSYDSSSITLQQPTFSTAGNPMPTVQAYIGVNGTISVSGSTVSGSIQGPIDISSGGYQFVGLNPDTSYKIIVVAANVQGYSVKQITQSTATIEWTRELGIAGTTTYGRSITSDSNDTVYVLGTTNGNLDGQTLIGTEDFFVTKYDNNGNKQWTRELGATGAQTTGWGITSDSNNNVYVTGGTTGNLDGQTLIGSKDFFVTKYDSNGNKQWTRELGTGGIGTSGSGITSDSNNNVYVTGSTNGNLDGQTLIGTFDFFVTKYDSSGNKLWTRELGATGSNTDGAGITSDSNNNVYVTGYTDGNLDGQTATGVENVFVTKYDSSGNKQWTRELGTTSGSSTYGSGITSDSNNNVYVTGYTNNSLDGQMLIGTGSNFFVTKYNSSGVKQWTRELGATTSGSSTYGFGITSDSNDTVYVSGTTNGNLDGQTLIGTEDFFVTKYDNNGNKQWTRELGVVGADTPGGGITSDSNNNVYVTGDTTGNLDGQTLIGTQDFFVIKYTHD